ADEFASRCQSAEFGSEVTGKQPAGRQTKGHLMNENVQDNITAEQIDAYGLGEQPTPSSAVKALDRLVGEWTVTGGAEGVIRYEWMTGRFFLLQHVELEQFGQAITGIEVIGQLHPF